MANAQTVGTGGAEQGLQASIGCPFKPAPVCEACSVFSPRHVLPHLLKEPSDLLSFKKNVRRC